MGTDQAGAAVWHCRDRALPVGRLTQVMGILNVTPDSFSDGGRYLDHQAALARALEMVAQGADIIDVGGESTRPGAKPVGEAEELDRVVPVIRALAAEATVPISVDTTKAGVARAALEAGAVIVNDVSALRWDAGMASVVADSGAGVVLMHMLGEPRTMQADPSYADVVEEVGDALAGWAAGAEAAGIGHQRIVIDPGIGFGKTPTHNLALLANLRRLGATRAPAPAGPGPSGRPDAHGPARRGYPVLVGPSRKSFIGATLGLDVGERRGATAAAVAWSVAQGAAAVRVHDVLEMVRVVRMTEAIRQAAGPERSRGRDKVVIQGLRVFGYHGVNPAEKQEGQEFVIDLEAYLDLHPAGVGDELARTLDYSALARRAAGIVAGQGYDLIEALAERLAAAILDDDRVQRAVVRVGKPEAAARHGAQAFAVEIERGR